MDISQKPIVTIACVCYNHEKFVIEALESVVEQTYRPIQIIIIDNESTDSSKELINEWIKQRKVDCEFISLDKNIGVCKVLNMALRKTKGAYFSMMSTDDILLPHKTEAMLKKMLISPRNVGIIYGDCYLIDEQGDYCNYKGEKVSEPHTFLQHCDIKGRGVDKKLDIFEDLFEGNFLHNLASLIRFDCFREVGFYDESLIYEDWDMNLRITKNYQALYLPGIFAKYRRHKKNFYREDGAFSVSTICLHVKHYGYSEKVNEKIEARLKAELKNSAKAGIGVFLKNFSLVFFRIRKSIFLKIILKVGLKTLAMRLRSITGAKKYLKPYQEQRVQ